MVLTIELDLEEDGRWIAEANPDDESLPTTHVYGRTREEAIAKAEAAILRIWADLLEQGATGPGSFSLEIVETKAA
ncbi:MAG: type II toxin-antitoxin system HicB family antitoxin [Candidatus Schekmanbacteria bacterium]|nr:type II toxin-antitoxin system HicB family antitoxin [Candidatus Schekmanbacteria bacterium]